jgi:hypothetical protein
VRGACVHRGVEGRGRQGGEQGLVVPWRAASGGGGGGGGEGEQQRRSSECAVPTGTPCTASNKAA